MMLRRASKWSIYKSLNLLQSSMYCVKSAAYFSQAAVVTVGGGRGAAGALGNLICFFMGVGAPVGGFADALLSNGRFALRSSKEPSPVAALAIGSTFRRSAKLVLNPSVSSEPAVLLALNGIFGGTPLGLAPSTSPARHSGRDGSTGMLRAPPST